MTIQSNAGLLVWDAGNGNEKGISKKRKTVKDLFVFDLLFTVCIVYTFAPLSTREVQEQSTLLSI